MASFYTRRHERSQSLHWPLPIFWPTPIIWPSAGSITLSGIQPRSRWMLAARQPKLRDLVTHIFQVEDFFADLLIAGRRWIAPRRPAQMASQSLEELRRHAPGRHTRSSRNILTSTSEEALQRTRTLGPVTVSNRKTLAQALLHSVHHWAQVAMAGTAGRFPHRSSSGYYCQSGHEIEHARAAYVGVQQRHSRDPHGPA